MMQEEAELMLILQVQDLIATIGVNLLLQN
jgi:hypothetical protein